MAIVKSQTWTAISGSVGGVTFAKSRQGYYMRARTVPVNPASTYQQQVRAALTALVTRWTETLTQAQRDSWELFAENVPVTNPLGDQVTLSGQQWFIAANTPRAQLNSKFATSFSIADQAPAIFNRGDFTTPTFVNSTEASGIQIGFTDSDNWANEDGSELLVFQGRPGNASRNFFKGPWRLLTAINGDSTTPPTSPVSVSAANCTANGYTVIAGEATSIEVAVSRADGRLSTRRFIGRRTAT